ncbi:hypothetical protein HPDFL43_08574 [Hoeflea phototrophica DFL-43]|jgi:hypothetical protein|uniref:Uncharacterized protein n=1 Tax=Hoeflea phototrophica (strain DSM 17068 / NCIMB 14078 / DFL-43) TaxID=411684 RepID=A9D9V5_HOEPD|nr:hypothetical protein [Hoeflea phototrophica]EDQ32990.1 hypothetical protein HPDFL43_08574 [Hoeflea phototrophica DFL-43]
MIYSFDILFSVFIASTGFATSWIALELVRSLGWRDVQAPGDEEGVLRRGAALALTAVIGPRLLLANGYERWRHGTVSLPLYAVIALIAVGWSMCSGVLVLQAAFASGYFLA